MSQTHLRFGTSGLRGPAAELGGQAARRYTVAFIRRLVELGQHHGGRIFIGRDFRASSQAISMDCAAAISSAGLAPVDCGAIPTPALALHAMEASCAAIMVTGSHIPADRNGLKFYLPSGEISKADELGICANLLDEHVEDLSSPLADEAATAIERYFERCANLLPDRALAGLRIGIFEHSTVARDVMTRVLRHYGAETMALGRQDDFIAVDTEAFGDTLFDPLQGWIAQHQFDAIISADGDGDRPLLMDSKGQFVRGDILGLLTACYLGAQTAVTPVTSNSGIERTGAFSRVLRTRVGSPYVIEAMASAQGSVVGFEANGGTFIGNSVTIAGIALTPLPTRDAMLPLLCVLGQAAAEGIGLDELVLSLPLNVTMADRLQDVPNDRSAAFLERLSSDSEYAETLFEPYGISGLTQIDGLRFQTRSGDIVHFRASGNAPELRCYVEGSTPEAAKTLLGWGMNVAATATS